MDVSLAACGRTPPAIRATRAGRVLLRLLQQRFDAGVAGPAPPFELARAMRLHAGRMLNAFNVEVVTRGVLPAADRPLLLVANHVSWLDPYVVNACNGARFVAKSEVATWPVIGAVAARYGTFFHRRGCFRDARRTVDALTRALIGGYPVGVFPEGTTTRGDRVLPFYPAFFQAAIDAEVPVQPLAIRYCAADGSATAAAAYAGGTLRESVGSVLASQRLVVELHFGARLAPHGDRRELAEESRETIMRLLWPRRVDLSSRLRRQRRRRRSDRLRLAS